MKSAILCFISSFLLYNSLIAQEVSDYHYGLSFKSHLYNLDERTSFDLSSSGPFKNLKNGFSIKFELKLRKEPQTFGYVFRMVVDEKESLDFLVNLVENEFTFVINDHLGQSIASKKYVNKKQIVSDSWMNVEVKCFLDYTEIKINQKAIFLNKGFKGFKNVEFLFGANKTKYFHTTEVPPITLRNIKLLQGNEVLYHWILAKHNKEKVYDEIAHTSATVQNAIWEIDQHAKWVKKTSLSLNAAPQIAFDPLKRRIFAVETDNIYIYSILNDKTDTVKVVGGNPYLGVSRQIIYNSKKDELISYTSQSPTYYNFSFKTNSWSGSPTLLVDSRQHHNHILDTTNNTINILMGYGYHKYDGGLMELDLNKNDAKWKNYSFNPIVYPRYLSALGLLDKQTALLLGGYGSKTGRQEEFPHNFYDLYKFDFKTGKNTKLWDLNIDTPNIVFSNSMHVDAKSNRLLVLGYNNFNYKSKIFLYGFDINTTKPIIQSYADAIPFNFLDIESYCDLFYDKGSKKLYAVISHKGEKGRQEVNIYSIAYPVFLSNDIYQETESPIWLYVWKVIGAILFLMVILYFIYAKRKNDRSNKANKVKVNALIEPAEIVKELALPINILRINLFNRFEIFDKSGVEHSGELTPILKQLFLCILLYNIKNGNRGVSSHILDQTFWEGMSQEKAVNNRSVNMRKLRVLLMSIGRIEIEHKNSHWILNLLEEFNCDYQTVLTTLQDIDKSGVYDKFKIQQVILLANGKLLPSIENEWVDSFKSEFTSQLGKILHLSLTKEEIQGDDNFRLRILEVILLHDSLDENAIIYKCNLLYKTGRKGQSKHTFDKYCVEYKHSLNVLPGLVYNDIILLNL